MAASTANVGRQSPIDDDDGFVYVFDRREKDAPEVKIPTGGLFSFNDFKERVKDALKLGSKDKFVIATTNREEIKEDSTWDLIDKEDTLYVLRSIDQELCAPAQERVNYLPHYDTIVKGGMYEYYASEGQNPLPYAFAELIDNALAATAKNVGARNIEIRLYLEDYGTKTSIYVIDNGKGMTPRQLNNWAIYRLSKFNRRGRRRKRNDDDSDDDDDKEDESVLDRDTPRSLNSDISYFGVGGKQAVFFIGSSTRMISRPKGAKDVHELTISKEEFEQKEKNHQSIYSGYIRNRKAGDHSHLATEDETLRQIIEEEKERWDSFTVVVIQGINTEHIQYLKTEAKMWTKQLAHIYHYYLHGPEGNLTSDEEPVRVPSPFKNIDIKVKLYTKGQSVPRVIDLRDVEDDLQTLFVRGAANVFEFKAVVEGSMDVEGVLRYHPFLYDRETYPYDINDPRMEPEIEDEHDYAITETPARGRRPIFECFWNGRLIPYTLIDGFEWCCPPKKVKTIPNECYNRISGVLWTDDNFQVSTNKLTFIDLELKLRDKNTVFSRVQNGEMKRTQIDKELTKWLAECHEQHDKQIHFTEFAGQIKRLDLPKNKQSPWVVYKQVEWDNKVFKVGQLVRILRTVPTLYGSISRIMLYGDHTGDIYATGGDLEVIQEPRSLYNEVKIVPLSKLDRAASQQLVRKYLEEEEAKLPSELLVSWPEGNQVVNNEKRNAGRTIGDIKVEILNKKGEKISKLPGTGATSKKLLVELKVIWHSNQGDQVINSHISQHGKNWPYWFRKMENIKNLGNYTLQLQAVLNESGENTFSGKELPSHKLKFSVTESEATKFSVGILEGPFRVGVPFNIPLEFQDEYNNSTKPNNKLKPELEATGLQIEYGTLQTKGNALLMKDVIAQGHVPSASGKNFSLTVRIPEFNDMSQSLKIRLLPGVPSQLLVEPEDEQVIENGKAAAFRVQVQDMSGNSTTTDGRQSILCKFSGATGLPSYSVDCSSVGMGNLTGDPIFLKKMKEEVTLTAKIDLQGYKNVKSVERRIKVVPSGSIADISVSYQDDSGQQVKIKNGEEIPFVAGETLDNLKITCYDEANREIKINDKLAAKIKVNWMPKMSKEQVMKGVLPGVKAPLSVSEAKYCQVSVTDKSDIEVGFILKPQAAAPSQMKCKIVGSNQLPVGQTRISDVHINIKDKYGNDIIHESDKICKEVAITGEGVDTSKAKITLDKAKSTVIVKDVSVMGGVLGRREIMFQVSSMKDYVRIESVAGPPAKLKFIDLDPEQVVTVYNESKFPAPLSVQVLDAADNICKQADVKVQIAKDPKLKFLPTPQLVRTNKDGIADFGSFTVSAPQGMYEIQPKCFINYASIGGSKIKISVQPDPTRPNDLSVEYNTKTVFIAGEKMPEFTVKVLAEDGKVLESAVASHLSLKTWKTEDGEDNSLPSRTLSYGPDSVKKPSPGVFHFKERINPHKAGNYNNMFVYYDGKHQLFSNVIHTKVEPATPCELIAVQDIGTPTVSNSKAYTTRSIIRNLKLELRDKYENTVTRGMNGQVSIEIGNPGKEKEVPVFVGGGSTVNAALAGGTCMLQNITIQENSPGKDGAEYMLNCYVKCNSIPKNVNIPPLTVPFLFYNGTDERPTKLKLGPHMDNAKKQSQMAALSKERDNLQSAIKTYKSLFETTEQLIEELKISVKESQSDENKVKAELRRYGVTGPILTTLEGIDKKIKETAAEKENLTKVRRRMCGLQPAPTDNEVLGKIGQLALIKDDECARVLSWHMSSDMDCVVTLTTKKAKDLYKQTGGRQQVLPLDSIYKKNLTEWKKPLPHVRFRPTWKPAGNPVYARDLLIFSKDEDNCKIVFAMLLGDTIFLDTLDDANAYRHELVKFTHCPTILTRDGDRIRSNGKFGGLMNKALPIEKLRGAIFGAPLSDNFRTSCTVLETLNSLKSAMQARQTAEDELQEQLDNMATPEMKAKYKECREAEAQLASLEQRLGVGTPARAPVSTRDPRKQKGGGDTEEEAPPSKKSRTSGGTAMEQTTSNTVLSTPTRQSRRIAAMTPDSDEVKKKMKKS